MERPASIVTFERCYLGAWIVGLANTALNWTTTVDQLTANPAVANLGASFASTVLVGSIAVGAALTLILWYFVARQGSVVAKWIVTILFAFGLATFLFGLAMGRIGIGPGIVVTVVTLALQGLAVAMLFRPDTRGWFGRDSVEPLA